MKRRNRGFTAYQQTLFNKYEIDESYLQTRKQRRACMELLEKIDRNQELDEKKTIEKIASTFQGSELYKRITSSVTIAALLVTLQSTPVMAQAASKLQTATAGTSITEQYRDKSVVLDGDSFVDSKAAAYSQEAKATSLHLVACKAAGNAYETLGANDVLVDGDSDVVYYPKQEVKTLTVIDTSVKGWETLRDGVKSGETLLLEGTEAPIDSILLKLEAMGEINCLNIISHGDGGRLGFENGTIDSEVLEANKDSWKRLSGYLGKDGDIQLFGCNIAKGEEGKKFIETLAQITGADVAASINPTGTEKQGGNWKLEAVTGEVAGNLPFTKQALSEFSYLLPLTVENQEFGLSNTEFSDNGDTVDNNYFSVSGTYSGGISTDMNNDSASAFQYHTHQNTDFQIIVDVDGTYLDTFELEDINLSLSDQAASNSYSIYDIQIIGYKDNVEQCSTNSIYIYEHDVAASGSFSPNLNGVFDNIELDRFVINAYTGGNAFGTNALRFNSFIVSNMTAPAPANTAPTIDTNVGITVEEDSEASTISNTMLKATDTEQTLSSSLTYTIKTAPAKGTLKKDTTDLATNSTFTQEDIDNGKITYTPSEDEDGADSFDFVVSDGAGGSTASTNFGITITSVNDAPTLTHNAGLTVDEDSLANTIDNTKLLVSDIDTAAASIVYTLTSDPSQGLLKKESTLLSASGADNTFTQADINGNSVTYAPGANYNGTDSFTFTVSDGSGENIGSSTFDITVNAVNDAPTVSNNTKTGTEETVMAFTADDFKVDYNDVDDGTFSGIKIVTLPDPSHGVLKLSGTDIVADDTIAESSLGSITFEPEADFNGSTSFTWQVSDGADYSPAAATMTLNLANVNDAPAASDNSFTTVEDTAIVNGDLTASVTDVDTADTMTYSLETGATHGTVTVNANGTFTYTPAADYSGTDSFTWCVSDGTALDTATATITVSAVNDAPTVSNNIKNGTEDMTMTFTVEDFKVGYSDVENNAFNGIKIVTLPDPTRGVLKLSGVDIAADDVIAESNLGDITFEPAANFNGSTSFTWQVSDGAAYSAAATMNLNVASVNDAPAAADNSFTTVEDTAIVNGDLTASVTDVDTADTMTYSLETGATHGTVTVNANGTFTYTPAADYSGADSFTWCVSDGTALDTATATITVSAVNDAPTVSNNIKNGTEDMTMTFTAEDFKVGYSDAESDVFSGIKIVTLPDPAHGVLKLGGVDIAANDVIAESSLAGITFEPAADFNGSASFTWQVSDGAAYSAAATMTISIANANDAPAASDNSFTTDEDTAIVSGDLTASVTDVDTADIMTYSLETGATHGTVTVNANGTFTYTPEANFNGTDSFVWRVSDGAASDTATASITVSPVNDAPMVSNNTKNGAEDTTMTFTAEDFKIGYSDAESDVLGDIKIVTLPDPSHGVLKLSGVDIAVDDVIAEGSLGSITFEPAADFSGSASFTWQVSDGTAYSAAATMTLSIASVNDAPVATNNSFTTSEDTAIVNGDLTASVTDVDTADTMTYSLVSDTAHGAVTVNANGTFTYTPETNYSGSDSFVWSVSDGTASDTATAGITVSAVNDAPVVSSSTKNGTEDHVMSFTLSDFNKAGVYSDVESTALNKIQIITLPDPAHGILKLNGTAITAGVEITAGNLINMTFEPAANFNGSAGFTWKGSDGTEYSSAAATMTLGIAGVNDAPAASGNSFATAEDTAIVNGNLTASVTDVDTSDTMTYSLETGAAHGTVTVSTNGTFTYTPEVNYSGTDSFTWRVSDGIASDTAIASITVNAVNDIPEISGRTKNGTEDTTITFTAGDFSEGYSDAENSALSGIRIVTLPDASEGVLMLNNSAIAAGQEIPAGSFDGITFEPTANFNGSTSFTWEASDGTTYSAAATMTLNIADVIDVPAAPTDINASAGDGKVTVTFTTPADNGGSTITKYIVTSVPGGIMAEGTASPITVTGLTNGTAYTFKVAAVNEAGTGTESVASNEATPQKVVDRDRDDDKSRGTGTTPTTGGSGIDILVNGKAETAATGTTTQAGDQTVLTVAVDGSKVEEKLQSEGNNSVVTIAVNNTQDVVVGQLNGQTIKNMETKEAVLEIRTENVTYTLPASQINIDSISSQLGTRVELKDITVSVAVSEPSAGTVKVVEDAASKGNYQIIVKPVQFDITCTNAGKTIEVNKFNAYVERMVAVPEGVDPGRITTGIVLNADGTFSHVPTQIVIVNGKYYAKINSLTNSTYSVIWNPKTFKDVERHWAREAVNDMGSRLVVAGVGDEQFAPDRYITRAEFASILVKGLGLMRPGTGKAVFSDVSEKDWYYDAVSIAYENGLVLGMDNGMFRPEEQLTREQAIAMVARAMDITGLNKALSDGERKNILAGFIDSKEASEWASEGVAVCINSGIIEGKNKQTLAPKDLITRAEVAVIIERLLQKSDLI